ncbi:MAG: alpha/beta fold hydrolase [Roseiflexaceae bacterium]|nr:alpha/beta fold hydrolase [Roseiflexaceae bacterium]
MKESTSLRPRAAGFSIDRGDTGVLLIHGYSGSPTELRELGDYLAARGYSVAAPLLSGHGAGPDALFEVGWQRWLADALIELAWLRRRCRRVVVLGFSMGALLASVLVARVPVAGVILAAPALRLRGQPLIDYADVAARIQPWYYPLRHANFGDPAVRAAVLGFAPEIDLDDPAVVAQVRQAARVPIGSIYEMVRLQRRARRDLPHIHAPALVMQGRADLTVNPASAKQVHRLLGSQDKQLIWFEHSGHQLPREAEKEQVWQATATWIAAR